MLKARLSMVLSLVLALAVCLCACAGVNADSSPAGPSLSVQDEPPKRVVVLSSSLAELWMLAGGTLTGTTSDTLERNFDGISEDVALVGTVKDPGLEAILELEPDFVILSEDIAGHMVLKQTLEDADIAYHAVHVETFSDYLDTLELFCGITGNTELFQENGTKVQEQIDRLLAGYEPASPSASYLLMRVHSSGGKVIANDHIVCDMMNELGVINIAAQNQSLLSDLSLEAILESAPDYIFVVTMGEEETALQTLEQMFTTQTAWKKLSAVQNGRVHILPKELFHYKPNAKWGEAYEALVELLTA